MTDESRPSFSGASPSEAKLDPIDQVVSQIEDQLVSREPDDDTSVDALFDCLRLNELSFRLTQLRAQYFGEYTHTIRKEELILTESALRVTEAEYGTTRAIIGNKKDGDIKYQDRFEGWRKMLNEAELGLGVENLDGLYIALREKFGLTESTLD